MHDPAQATGCQQREQDGPTHVWSAESDQGRTVGSCSVVRLADGTWVVDGGTASDPNTPPS